jgi:hypothetical protein
VNEDRALQEDPEGDEEREEEREKVRENSAGSTCKSTDCCLLRYEDI